ncbi:hypothetical protein ACF08N_20220 [Streptomyces sp. NPDC015127]
MAPHAATGEVQHHERHDQGDADQHGNRRLVAVTLSGLRAAADSRGA